MDWKEIKRIERSFRKNGELICAQQVFHRMISWLFELMGDDAARTWMLDQVNPDPELGWDFSLGLGDSCPRHLEEKLTSTTHWHAPSLHGFRLFECAKCQEEHAQIPEAN